MRFLCLLLLSIGIASPVAAQDNTGKKLVGTWDADFTSIELTGKLAEQIQGEDLKAFKEVFAMAKMTLIFTHDKKYTMQNQMPGEKEEFEEGEWDITSSQENEFTITFKSVSVDKKEREQAATIELESDDKFALNIEGLRISFSRRSVSK